MAEAGITASPIHPDALPDFRNLGVIMRILLGVNAALLVAAVLDLPAVLSMTALPQRVGEMAALLEPVLLASVVLLYVLARPLLRLPYLPGMACVIAICLLVTWGSHALLSQAGLTAADTLHRHLAYAGIMSLAMLEYFRLRNRALSPALSEARLQALQARIRPHFLFNSLTAVLSLMRSDPRRAESALEDLSELFRTLMADNRALTTLAEEVALTRRYLDIEQLRLGERLQVKWQIDEQAGPAAVPPLMLQPLVENAVYHGIEPGLEPGLIAIAAQARGEQLSISISNPYHPEHQHRQGNRMALANIGERLRLHFDVEAQLHTRIAGDRFEISVLMPLRRLT